MKKNLFALFFIGLFLFPTILSAQIATQSNNFSFQCYQYLSKGNQDNLFFSPLSVNAALSMAYAGAEGSTQVAFEKMMDLSDNKENNLASLADYFHQINSIKNVELNFVNQFWYDNKMPIKSSYSNQLALLSAQSNRVDFGNSAETARNQINQSINESTKGKINDLLPEGSVDGLTQFIMTNAVYFMGDWANAFEIYNSEEAAFYVNNGESYTATFMNKSSMYGYYETDKVQILELPYKGNTLSMVIILPKKDQDLDELTAFFNQNQYEKWLDNLTYEEVDVAFPKFKTGSNIKLANYFAEMGLEEAFSNQADFTGISDKTTKLSKIFHQSFIDVNEKGTEASAATATVGTSKGISRVPIFKANRPFMYLIKENKNNQVIFMGRLTNPTQKKTSFENPSMARNTAKKEFIHIVAQGETIFKIARAYNLKPNEISAMNNLENDLIFEGQKLIIQSESTNKGVMTASAPQIPKEIRAIPVSYSQTTKKQESQPKIEIIAIANKENLHDAPKNYHIVQQGETLYSISKKYNLNIDDLKTSNQLTTNDLDKGMKLLLEQRTFYLIQYKVKDGDSLSKIARNHNTTVERIKILNQLSSDMIYSNQELDIEQ